MLVVGIKVAVVVAADIYFVDDDVVLMSVVVFVESINTAVASKCCIFCSSNCC